MMTETAQQPSAALAQFVQHVTGSPVKPIELKARVLCTHYLFEGPQDLLSMGDDDAMDGNCD